jgi:hypothetical protein
MYLAASPVPINFKKDYLLSPVVAPDELLARFPKTYLLCGEKDPLVDDTVVFAGRLREAKARARKEWDRLRDLREREANIDGGVHVGGKAGGAGDVSGGVSKNQDAGMVLVTSGKRGVSPGMTTTDDDDSSRSYSRSSEEDDEDEYGGATEVNTSDPSSSGRRNQLPPRTPTEFLSGFTEEDLSHHLFHRDPDEMVHVKILEGMSHAILQMQSILPEAKHVVNLLGDWCLDLLEDPESLATAGSASVRGSHGDLVLTDYLMEQFSEHGPHPPRHQSNHNQRYSKTAAGNAGTPPKSVMGGRAQSETDGSGGNGGGFISRAASVLAGGAGGSANGSPKPGKAPKPKRTIAGELAEHNVLERRRKVLASNHDI